MNKYFKDFETVLNEHQDTMTMLIRKELSKVPVISYRTSLELLKAYHLWLTSENDK